MKRLEAEQVFQMISTIYDLHPERAAEQATVWVPMLERQDAHVAMTVVNAWVEGRNMPERFPTVGVFAGILRSVGARIYEPVVDCYVCLDDGMVDVGDSEVGTTQIAPCPSCDKGKLIEHPLERRGPWGSGGFWRGRGWKKTGRCIVEMTS